MKEIISKLEKKIMSHTVENQFQDPLLSPIKLGTYRLDDHLKNESRLLTTQRCLIQNQENQLKELLESLESQSLTDIEKAYSLAMKAWVQVKNKRESDLLKTLEEIESLSCGNVLIETSRFTKKLYLLGSLHIEGTEVWSHRTLREIWKESLDSKSISFFTVIENLIYLFLVNRKNKSVDLEPLIIANQLAKKLNYEDLLAFTIFILSMVSKASLINPVKLEVLKSQKPFIYKISENFMNSTQPNQLESEMINRFENFNPKYVWIESFGLFINLENLSLKKIPSNSQFYEFLSKCGGALISKSDFFQIIWEQKYQGTLHDTVIYKLLSRFNKLMKTDFKVRSKKVDMRSLCIIRSKHF